MYLQDIEKNDYVVPDDKRDRFLFLVRRMEYAFLNEYEELYRGLGVVFLREFGSYRVFLAKGQIWRKGNFIIRVVGIKNGFVFYKKIGILNRFIGERFSINKFTFFRIFERN